MRRAGVADCALTCLFSARNKFYFLPKPKTERQLFSALKISAFRPPNAKKQKISWLWGKLGKRKIKHYFVERRKLLLSLKKYEISQSRHTWNRPAWCVFRVRREKSRAVRKNIGVVEERIHEKKMLHSSGNFRRSFRFP